MMSVSFPGLAGPVIEHAIRCRHENGRLLSYLADLNIFTILDVHMSIISGDKQSESLGFCLKVFCVKKISKIWKSADCTVFLGSFMCGFDLLAEKLEEIDCDFGRLGSVLN